MEKADINKQNQLLERTASFYENAFAENPEARRILMDNGIRDSSIYSRHRIGFADGSLLKALPKKGPIIDDLKAVGILTKDGKEYFNGCVIPVMNEENRIVNMSSLDGKLLPLAQGTFNKSIVKAYPCVFHVDSILDALSLEEAGILNVISGEAFGQCSPLDFPANEYLMSHGKEELKKKIEGEDEAGKNRYKFGLRSYELIGIERNNRKLKATVKANKNGKRHFDTINFYSAKERRQLAQDLTIGFDELPETINSDLERIMKELEKEPVEEIKLESVSRSDEKEAMEFAKSQDLMERIIEDFKTAGLIGEEDNALLSYLCMTSRKMDTPLSLMTLSSSGAGKSKLQDTCLKFCPPEELLKLTNLSGKALFYMGEKSIKHKLLALEEEAGAENASYAIRNLITSDGLTTETTVRDNETGKLTTQQNKVEGPVAVMVTTTKTNTDPETKSRFIITSISESKEQTKAILEAQRKMRTIEGLKKNLELERVVRTHRNFQRLLKPLKVVNPLAENLECKDFNLHSRRSQPKFLGLIETVAFLRQFSKEVKEYDDVEYIETDEKDLEVADMLYKKILSRSSDDLSMPSMDLLAHIKALATAKLEALRKDNPDIAIKEKDIAFTRRELCEFSGWRRSRLRVFLLELIDAELVLPDSSSKRKYYKLASFED